MFARMVSPTSRSSASPAKWPRLSFSCNTSRSWWPYASRVALRQGARIRRQPEPPSVVSTLARLSSVVLASATMGARRGRLGLAALRILAGGSLPEEDLFGHDWFAVEDLLPGAKRSLERGVEGVARQLVDFPLDV